MPELIRDCSTLQRVGEYTGYDLCDFPAWQGLGSFRTRTETRAQEKASIFLDFSRYHRYPGLVGDLASIQTVLALSDEQDFDLAMSDLREIVAKLEAWVTGKQPTPTDAHAQELAVLQDEIKLHQLLVEEVETLIAPEICIVLGNDWYAEAYSTSRVRSS